MSFPGRVRKGRRPAREWVQTPIFVYGTLRPGQVNYELLLRGCTVTELPASIAGMALYSLRTFPVIVEAEPDSIVQGEWIILHPAQYYRRLEDLDRLEGYNPAQESTNALYRREKRLVRLANGGEAWAWVYVGNRSALARLPHTLIPHGDWVRWQREHGRVPRIPRLARLGDN